VRLQERTCWQALYQASPPPSSAQEQELGAGANYQTLEAQRDLVVSESALVAATGNIVDTVNEIC
jgi:hypothetical protein